MTVKCNSQFTYNNNKEYILSAYCQICGQKMKIIETLTQKSHILHVEFTIVVSKHILHEI